MGNFSAFFSGRFSEGEFPTWFVKLIRKHSTCRVAGTSLPLFLFLLTHLVAHRCCTYHLNFPTMQLATNIYNAYEKLVASCWEAMRDIALTCRSISIINHQLLDDSMRNVIIGFNNPVIFFVNETEWIGFAANYIFNRSNL